MPRALAGGARPSASPIAGGATLPTLDMLSRVAQATGSTLRLAAPGVGDIELGGAA